MSLNWNFQRGGGSNPKTLRGGEYGHFWNNTVYGFGFSKRINLKKSSLQVFVC